MEVIQLEPSPKPKMPKTQELRADPEYLNPKRVVAEMICKNMEERDRAYGDIFRISGQEPPSKKAAFDGLARLARLPNDATALMAWEAGFGKAPSDERVLLGVELEIKRRVSHA